MSSYSKTWAESRKNWFRYYDGSVVASSATGSIANCFEFIGGSSVPGYRSKIRTQQDASSAYTRRSLKFNTQSPMLLSGRKFNNFTKEWWWLEGEYHLAFSPATTDIVDPAFLAKIQMGFVEKLLATRRQLSGGVVLGELGKTIHMLRNPAEAIVKGLRSYLRTVQKRTRAYKPKNAFSRRDKVRDLNKVIAGTWLEYQFGIKPFVSDVKDAAIALSRILNNEGHPTERCQFKGKYSTDLPAQAGPAISIPGWFSASTEATVTSSYEVSYTGLVKIPLPPANWVGSIKQGAAMYGLTATDILPTIWNLIPLSCLTDYVVNVGAILDSLGVLKVEPICLNRSIMTRRYGSLSISGQTDTIFAPGVFRDVSQRASGLRSTLAYVNYSRNTISVGDLIPPLTFKMPGTSTKYLNVAAVFAMANDITTDILGNKLG